MQQIRPWLYIGKYSETLNAGLLQRAKIRAMLQLAEAVKQTGIESLYLPVDDGVPMQTGALANGVAFVRSEYAQGNRVLVACGAGISRATTFAIAALKEEENLSVADAFSEIIKHHPNGMPHPVLWESLCKFYGEDVPFLAMWTRIHRQIDSQKSGGL
jgi:protein-tyrosine phosphatase